MADTIPVNEGLNFEKVWAMFQEVARRQEEIARRQEEAARWQEEFARRQAETDRQISKLGSRIGQLIEHFAASNILEKFREKQFQFTRISRNHLIKDEKGKILAELDLMLENGDYVMVVEVKSFFSHEDVKDHFKRMNTLRVYADQHGDQRKYLGAAAGALIEETTREYALSKGLYVIEQTGDTVNISEPEQMQIW